MKVAIVHQWPTNMSSFQKVVPTALGGIDIYYGPLPNCNLLYSAEEAARTFLL